MKKPRPAASYRAARFHFGTNPSPFNGKWGIGKTTMEGIDGKEIPVRRSYSICTVKFVGPKERRELCVDRRAYVALRAYNLRESFIMQKVATRRPINAAFGGF